MSYNSTSIANASALPLQDAAFLLWSRKSQLDRELEAENPSSSVPTPKQDLQNDAVFRKVVQSAIASVLFERQNAHNGSTFTRLKEAHPNATSTELESAIRAAVKFDQDCMAHFEYIGKGVYEEATRAVDLAKAVNSGFTEPSFEEARLSLATAMR